jgi:uncharacterized protein YaaQ
MKLVIAIIHEEDAAEVLRALAARGLQSTRLASEGGFLAKPNATLLIGVEDARVEEVKEVLAEKAKARHVESPGGRVEVGGAVVFVVEALEFLRL